MLSHCPVSKTCYEGVYFLFATDTPGFVQNVLLLLFGQMGVVVHGGSVLCQRHAEAGSGVIDEDVGHCADEFAILDDRAPAHADVK